jgi:uncharacterized protein (DUF1697 family)
VGPGHPCSDLLRSDPLCSDPLAQRTEPAAGRLYSVGMRYAVLLRGVNVGGRNKIAMADLRRILTELGYADVKTHLQSGNAVVSCELPPARLASAVGAALEAELGLRCAVLIRAGAELADVIAGNPLGREPDNPSRYFVAFLSAPPDGEAAGRLRGQDFGPDRAWLAGAHGYMWCPNGMADTKLTYATLEKQLGVVATARNWNTVRKLAELTAG